MKFTAIVEGFSLALVVSTAAAAAGPPPSWVGADPLPLPEFHPPPGNPAWSTQLHTSSAWPHPTGGPSPTKKAKVPAFTLFSGENALAYAVAAPVNASGSDSGSADITGNGANSTVQLTALGQGGKGVNGTGPGSIASGIGAGTGSQNLTASANAASAAAIVNHKATDVYLSTNATAKSTTFNTTHGPVTIAQAWSISEASDYEGDYAFYWAWAYSYISPTQNYTIGDNGGFTFGEAEGGADHGGWYGWGGPFGGNGGNNDPNAAGTAQYGRASATASAGTVSATVQANDPRQVIQADNFAFTAYDDYQYVQNITGGGVAIAQSDALGLPSGYFSSSNAQSPAAERKGGAAAFAQAHPDDVYSSASSS